LSLSGGQVARKPAKNCFVLRQKRCRDQFTKWVKNKTEAAGAKKPGTRLKSGEKNKKLTTLKLGNERTTTKKLRNDQTTSSWSSDFVNNGTDVNSLSGDPHLTTLDNANLQSLGG